MTPGAIGYDAFLRVIVSAKEMDPQNTHLRKTLFDFKNQPEDECTKSHIVKENGELVYRMSPHESVLGGIGFVTAMDFPMFFWVAPRSGLASKWGITVTNAPGTVDPDYRGEAGVLIYNRNDHSFDLKKNMRIAQIIFQLALIPDLNEQNSYYNLPDTKRGLGDLAILDYKNYKIVLNSQVSTKTPDFLILKNWLKASFFDKRTWDII